MKTTYFSVVCVWITATLLSFATVAWAQDVVLENPREPVMAPGLNLGKMNYETFCASCHGKTARGTDKGPSFISKIYHPGHHGDGAFYLASKRGVRAHHWPFGNMPPIEGVNDAQIQSIIEYVRAIQKTNGVF